MGKWLGTQPKIVHMEFTGNVKSLKTSQIVNTQPLLEFLFATA